MPLSQYCGSNILWIVGLCCTGLPAHGQPQKGCSVESGTSVLQPLWPDWDRLQGGWTLSAWDYCHQSQKRSMSLCAGQTEKNSTCKHKIIKINHGCFVWGVISYFLKGLVHQKNASLENRLRYFGFYLLKNCENNFACHCLLFLVRLSGGTILWNLN